MHFFSILCLSNILPKIKLLTCKNVYVCLQGGRGQWLRSLCMTPRYVYVLRLKTCHNKAKKTYRDMWEVLMITLDSINQSNVNPRCVLEGKQAKLTHIFRHFFHLSITSRQTLAKFIRIVSKSIAYVNFSALNKPSYSYLFT